MINSKLYTIGYGNKTSIEIFSLLKKYGIEKLIDVRSIPYSKFRPMFNKNNLHLQAGLEKIEYVFKGNELGAKFNGSYPSYEILRNRYEYLEGLKYLIEMLGAGYNIAIMCCESDYRNCHRNGLIGEDMFQLGYEVVHIGKEGELIQHERLIL